MNELDIHIKCPSCKMEHTWVLGWKEIRGHFVDKCLNCGALRLLSISTNYVKQEVVKFLTTKRPVEFFPYFPCLGGFVDNARWVSHLF